MIYIVSGGRDFTDAERLNAVLRTFVEAHNLTAVMEGQSPGGGADKLAEDWAKANDLLVDHLPRPADWNKYRGAGTNQAGFIRNQEMTVEVAQHPNGAGLIAFWDGRSRGTKDMIEKATRCNLEVHIYRY